MVNHFFLEKRGKMLLILILISIISLSASCSMTGNSTRSFDTPENTLKELRRSINNQNVGGLTKIFIDDDYAFVLRDMFFPLTNNSKENVSLEFGFPQDDDLKKKLVTTNDLKDLIPGRMKMLDDKTAITAVRLKTERIKPFTGVVMQKIDDEWKISRLYDFMVIDSPMIEIDNFDLDFFRKSFNLTLKLDESITKKGYQTTYFFNTYLMLKKIDVVYHGQKLCSLDKEDVKLMSMGQYIKPIEDDLYMIDNLIIDGRCDYSSIVDPSLEQKYLLEIIFWLENNMFIKAYYYGDLRL